MVRRAGWRRVLVTVRFVSSLAVVASMLGFGCGTKPPPPIVLPPCVRRELALHADTSFTGRERELITRASAGIELQTCLKVRLTYDVDFNRLRTLKRSEVLLRITSDLERVSYLDQRFHGRVLGYTVWTDRRAALVVDRLAQPERFLRAAQHELLHLAGVPDSTRGSIMNPRIPGEPWILLNQDDLDAVDSAEGP